MAAVLTVPLSFDVEHGDSDDPTTVADTIPHLTDAGVAGINIEVGPHAPGILASKIEAIKNRATPAGVDFFGAMLDLARALLTQKLVQRSEARQTWRRARAHHAFAREHHGGAAGPVSPPPRSTA